MTPSVTGAMRAHPNAPPPEAGMGAWAEAGAARPALEVVPFEALLEFGLEPLPPDPVRDQETLDRMRESLAAIRRLMEGCRAALEREARQLAAARRGHAAAPTAEGGDWVARLEESVRQAREEYRGMQALAAERAAGDAPLIARLEAAIAHGRLLSEAGMLPGGRGSGGTLAGGRG